MGAGMAERLLDQGFTVDVWDRTPAVAGRIAAHGATAHIDIAEALRQADVVITMLATPDAVIDLMLRRGGLEALRAKGVWAQMATIGVEATESLIAEVAKRRPDVSFVDSPVSGTREPARNGQLTILASGPNAGQKILEPVFAALGNRVLWLGSAGQGTRMKLVLNTWLAFEVEAVAEVSATAHRLGVPYESLLSAVNGGPLASGAALARLAKMETSDDAPQFPLEWALKDLDLTAAAAGAGAAPVAAAIADRWRGLVGEGLGRLDVSAARFGLNRD
ncbi:MAG TPA: NAD(P)-dependent oxidoreductase, partial [Candidatus Dormibacteraeota bacterium]|nr:NAD(P)-dependent oxidoreductase [Candidatus Dormibacteraeota bacterium]